MWDAFPGYFLIIKQNKKCKRWSFFFLALLPAMLYNKCSTSNVLLSMFFMPCSCHDADAGKWYFLIKDWERFQITDKKTKVSTAVQQLTHILLFDPGKNPNEHTAALHPDLNPEAQSLFSTTVFAALCGPWANGPVQRRFDQMLEQCPGTRSSLSILLPQRERGLKCTEWVLTLLLPALLALS